SHRHPPAPVPLTIFFVFNHTAPTEIYTLSLHDALPIWKIPTQPSVATKARACVGEQDDAGRGQRARISGRTIPWWKRRSRRGSRSEEHTSELQSLTNLVCRLLLAKKKNRTQTTTQGCTL